ncbi:MAG: serine/threonine protein kinase, partial [Planctomycetota bacterium]
LYLYHFLLHYNLVPKEQLEKALRILESFSGQDLTINLGEILIRMGALSRERVQEMYVRVDSVLTSSEHQEDSISMSSTLGVPKSPPRPTPRASHRAVYKEEFSFSGDLNLVGKIIGDFRIIQELGQGGMGVVYKAHQITLDRVVALKMLNPSISGHKEALERFKREAQVVAKLNHPNIVQVYSVHQYGKLYYFAMEYVPGKSLDQYVKDFNPSLTEKIQLMIQACEAMAYAHSKGVVHRDLKPSNMLVTKEKKLLISDFGLVRVLGKDSQKLTASGAVLGTPAYMAPEQAMGDHKVVDPRADIYSLGVTLYELVTSKTPFEGQSSHDILFKIVTQEAPPPRNFKPNIDSRLENIIVKAMRKEPAKRYSTALEFAKDLKRYLAGEQVEAKGIPWWEKLWMSFRKKSGAWIAAVSFLVIATLIGVSIFILSKKEKEKKSLEHLAQREKQQKEREKKRKLIEATFKDYFQKINHIGNLLSTESMADLKGFLKELNDLTQKINKWEKPKEELYSSQIWNQNKNLLMAQIQSEGVNICERGWQIQRSKLFKSCQKDEIMLHRNEMGKWKTFLTSYLQKLKISLDQMKEGESKKELLLFWVTKKVENALWSTNNEMAKLQTDLESLSSLFQNILDFQALREVVQIMLWDRQGKAKKILGKIQKRLQQQKSFSTFKPYWRTYYYYYFAKSSLIQRKMLVSQPNGIYRFSFSPSWKIEDFLFIKREYQLLKKALENLSSSHPLFGKIHFLYGLVLYHFPYYKYYFRSSNELLPPLVFDYRKSLNSFLISALLLQKGVERDWSLYLASQVFLEWIHFWKDMLLDVERVFWNYFEQGSLRFLSLWKHLCYPLKKEDKIEIPLTQKLIHELRKNPVLARSNQVIHYIMNSIGTFKENKELLKKEDLEILDRGRRFLEKMDRSWFLQHLGIPFERTDQNLFLQLYLAKELIQKGKYKKGEEIIQRILKKAPNHPLAKDMQLLLYQKRGDKNLLSDTLAFLPQKIKYSLPLIFQIAEYYHFLGENELASSYWQKGLSLEEELNFSPSVMVYYSLGMDHLKKALQVSLNLRNITT